MGLLSGYAEDIQAQAQEKLTALGVEDAMKNGPVLYPSNENAEYSDVFGGAVLNTTEVKRGENMKARTLDESEVNATVYMNASNWTGGKDFDGFTGPKVVVKKKPLQEPKPAVDPLLMRIDLDP